jgi:hypothetical protein
MEDIYKTVLYIQEMCGSAAIFAKTINADVKKFYNKDDVEAVLRIRIALDSLQSTVTNLDMAFQTIEKGA